MCLHPDENDLFKSLNVLQRLNVAINVANALDYLHHHCEAPVIHCDLKPRNVPLDDDMVAYVGDFGLARILADDVISYSQTQSSMLEMKGSIGDIAPVCFLAIPSKKLREKLAPKSSMRKSYLQVTYKELFKATDGFSSANLIGKGSYSSVYRGIIDRMERIVAIKIHNLQKRRASESFTAECRALSSICHRNIVRVLIVCSSINFSGNDFKALILEYMSNGSLDNWLHQNANEYHQLRFVSLIQRLNVAIDIACALDYLHHQCSTTFLHCDLKPSNVLLDDDMVAHVEYGMAANASTYGDVYSYGILLLEMLTGKRPSDDMFENNLNLHQFAKMALPERVMEIIDRQLLSHENEVIRQSEIHNKLKSIMHETLVSLMKIGVSCSNDSPRERMEMKDVVIELHKVRDFYLCAEK
ncbi:hypothetical protein AAC387_Pa04g0917 [Persea americana]